MKRIFVIFVSVMLLVPVALFAAGEGEETTSESMAVELNEPGQYPVVLGDEPYEIDVFTIYLPNETNGNREEAAFTTYLEDLTNVRVTWVEVANADVFADRQNLLISSGDLPDVIMSQFGMSLQEVFTYGSSGTFHPLTEYVESSMPNLGQKLAENPTLARQLYMPDGEVYALPEFQNCYQCQYSKRAYVYEPWLEELGMDRPTTTDEFREMLIAFRDEDPNRNGLQDEIPYMTATTGWESSPWEFLMSSFIYTTRNDGAYLMRDGDEVRFVANTPEWREGLRYMTGLVEDGLLAPESFVQQNDQLRALVENEDAALVGVTHGGFPGVFTVVGGETGRYRNYDTLAPLEGPNGVRQTWHQPASLRPHTKVTVAEERPDIVAQWADFFYGNLSNYLLAKRYWVEGEDYRFTTPEEQEELITADATPALAIPNEGSARYGLDQCNDSWGRTAPRFIVAGWEALVDLDDPLNFGARLMRSVRDRYEPHKSDNWMPSGLIFEPAVTDELADLEEAITADTGIVERWSTQFVVGERDINDDEEWNDYLDALERAGVERYVELWDQRVRAAGFLD